MQGILQTARAVSGISRWSRLSFEKRHAEGKLKELHARRTARFLTLMRHAVYAMQGSPYSQLLQRAGCTYGDLEALVTDIGLEGALKVLAAEGVYVTHDEMKGREAARRGSQNFHFTSRDFCNPLIRPFFEQRTSGSTGQATRISISLEHYREQLLHTALSLRFHGLKSAQAALWLFPCEWSFSRGMRLAKLLGSLERWFTPFPLASFKRGFFRGAAHFGFISLLRLTGSRISIPEQASLQSPHTVVDWMAAVLKQQRRVFIISFPATAVRTCLRAKDAGVSLNGVVWLVGGEPVTRGKREAIEASGACCLPLFGCTETGESAEGCLKPLSSDDMHVYEHRFALTSRTKNLGHGQEVTTPLFTSLSPHTPLVFLNGDTGDVGTVERRDCGCPWGRMGFRTHLRDVWSYAKFTAEGMTMPGQVLMDILERELPQRFGGESGQYQLVAEPGPHGVARYQLLVSPELENIAGAAVAHFFSQALARTTHRDMSDFLNQAGQFRVVRRLPKVQTGGKSLPFLVQRQ